MDITLIKLETFLSSFGVNIDNRLKDEFLDGDPVTSFEAIKVYNLVAQSINSELPLIIHKTKHVLLKDYTTELNTLLQVGKMAQAW